MSLPDTSRKPDLPATADRMHIALAASEVYVPHAAAVVNSILRQHPDEAISIYLLHTEDLPQQLRTLFIEFATRKNCSVQLIEVPAARLQGLLPLKFIAIQLWLRILLPELLPSVSRVLYLDCDTIITDSLLPLWHCDLGANQIAAVNAPLPFAYKDWPLKLGLSTNKRYFGSGVILMDLDAMRRNDSQARILDYAREHGTELLWRDQDALNAVLGDSWLELHPRWNLMNSIAIEWEGRPRTYGSQEIQEALECPAIVHYENHPGGKPWEPGCLHPHRHLYFSHARETPWAGLHKPVGRRERLRNAWWRIRMAIRPPAPAPNSRKLSQVVARTVA